MADENQPKPEQAAKSSDAAGAVQQAKPAQAATSAHSAKPEAAKPEHAAKPAHPEKPAHPGKPAQPGAPANSGAPAQPAKPAIRHIVRVSGVDLEGKKTVKRSILKIKGVGIPLANAIVSLTGLHGKKTSDLTEADIKHIEQILENPTKAGIPAWMVNRQKDYETGDDIHIHGAKIPIYKRHDVSRLQKIRSHRGIRHALGLKLRGQRTRSTGRGGKSIGVVRKKGGAQ